MTIAPATAVPAARPELPGQRSGTEPDPTPKRHGDPERIAVTAGALRLLAGVLIAFLLAVTLIGGFSHSRAQHTAYAELRDQLANGTASVGRVTAEGKPLPVGAPVAILQIPQLRVREVVSEGTTSEQLQKGAGHRRDSVLPGQPGVSVLLGRRLTYGGPFSRISHLKPGDRFSVITGQGEQQFAVLGVRRAGDLAPPALKTGEGRLTLVTTAGPAYLPDGILRVDAELVSPAQSGPRPPFSSASLPSAERSLGGESGAWFPVVLWAQALLLVALGVVWLRARWGLWQTWLVGLPVLLAVAVTLAGDVSRLLPNLL